MKIKMLLCALFLMGNMVRPVLLHAQDRGEFGFMRVLGNIAEYPKTIPGPNGPIDMLMLLVTEVDASNEADTVGKKHHVAYIPATPANREILNQKKPFWIDTQKRIAKNGDWVLAEGNEGYPLVYAWGQIRSWSPFHIPSILDLQQFGHIQLDHIVRIEVSPRYKTGTFVKKTISEDMFQLLVTKVSVDGGKTTFTKSVVYINKNETNEKILSPTFAFFIDYAPMVLTKEGWVESRDEKDKKKIFDLVFNWGDIYKVRFVPTDSWKNLPPTPSRKNPDALVPNSPQGADQFKLPKQK